MEDRGWRNACPTQSSSTFHPLSSTLVFRYLPRMDQGTVVLLVVIVVAALIVIGLPIAWYNKLVRLRQLIKESWGNVDVQLKRRYDLIPNLVNTVKGYATHEKDVLERVVEARNRAQASRGAVGAQSDDERRLVDATRQLFAVIENYPD